MSFQPFPLHRLRRDMDRLFGRFDQSVDWDPFNQIDTFIITPDYDECGICGGPSAGMLSGPDTTGTKALQGGQGEQGSKDTQQQGEQGDKGDKGEQGEKGGQGSQGTQLTEQQQQKQQQESRVGRRRTPLWGGNALGGPIKMDVVERDKEFLIKADVPGIPKEEIKVTIENGILTIKGERKQEKEEEKGGFRRVERSYGMVQRSLRLPQNVDSSNVQAKYEHGVLNVQLPKVPAPPTPAPQSVNVA